MICSNPYKQGVAEYGCGQCMPCRLNRRRIWTGRLLLEATQHLHKTWCTLTYNDENLPKNGSLEPKDYQLFLKRLRKALSPKKIRYYIVGEYGDQTERPHYHAAIFGTDNYDVIRESWKMGNVHFGEINPMTMSYNASHITKGLHNPKNPVVAAKLNGRYPEFQRMSLRPGIGYEAAKILGDYFTTEQGSKYLAENADVGRTVRIGGLKYPIGKYLTGVAREQSIGQKAMTSIAKFKMVEQSLNLMHNSISKFEEEKKLREQKRKNDKLRAQNLYERSIMGKKI